MRKTGAILALAGVFFGLAAGLAGEARAGAGPWLDQEQARLRLVSGGQAADDPGILNLGLHFELSPGWKIYWRSPGDAGYAPRIDWTGSENLAEADMRWPVPHRFSLFGLETFGYSDEVVLPIDARIERPGEPVLLNASVDYLICKEICIPQQAVLRLEQPGGPPMVSAEAALIERYRALVPGDGTAAGLELNEAILTGPVEAPTLRVTARSDTPFEAPDVLIEAPPGFAFAKPEVALRDGGRTAVLQVAATATGESVLEGKRLTLTVTDGTRALEREVIARQAAAPSGGGATPGVLAAILGLALLGGLILNLMPCVLPVLSIKLLSVVKQGGAGRAQVRASFLATAAGVLASFLVLAGGAIALKALGLTVGWGIQFQQPLFLAAMALVVSVFAYNLFGFFEIALPRWAQGTAPAGAADGRAGLAGHFATGAFATLLATPCSAPFLGTAVGFALARGPLEIVLIFAVLGLGLALPYLAVAAAPALVARLPRPGPWMVVLRRILGFALAATAAWLLSVLAAQVGVGPAAGVGALLLALGLVFYLAPGGRRLRPVLGVLGIALAVAAVALPVGFAAPGGAVGVATRAPAAEAGAWRPLDQDAIASLVGEGKVVFVDVTADWCITCQVNKRLVLDSRRVRERLDDAGVATMRGDWTLPDPAISRYLERFGRYGIPFNAVYGPGAPAGVALPELLTVDAVLRAMDRAAGG